MPATTATLVDGDVLPPADDAAAFRVSAREILERGNSRRRFATHSYTQVFGIIPRVKSKIWKNRKAAVPADAFRKHLL